MADIRSVKMPDWITKQPDNRDQVPLWPTPIKPTQKRERIDPAAAGNFLDEIVAVCHRHGLWIIGDHACLLVTSNQSDEAIREAYLDV